MDDKKRQAVTDEFFELVNLSVTELQNWLDTPEAKSVGWTASAGVKKKPGGEKSEGYKSGEMILEILDKPSADLTESDYSHMRRVNGYIKRHLGQHPNKDVTNSRWRYSL